MIAAPEIKKVNIGLTARGTPRIHHTDWCDAIVLKSQIDSAAASIGKVYRDLPATAQAELLKLAHNLSDIRRQIL